jgi:3-phosphoglycerate kinase
MSRGIISKVIDEIGETQAEVRAEEYTMVNVRPGGKVAAMLDLVAALSGKTASVVVAGDLSTRLAAYAYSSSAHADAIINAAQEVLEQDGVLQPGSALDILNKADVLEVESSFEKELCSKLFSK